MAKAKATTTDTPMRKCTGSTKFGIPDHVTAIADFPVQPSGKDGLGRMCKPHWTEYTRGLRKSQRVVTLPDGSDVPVSDLSPAQAVALDEHTTALIESAKTRTPRGTRAIPGTGQASEAVERAREVVAATDRMGGRAYLDAIASDEVQAALRVLAGTSEGPAIHESMRERMTVERADVDAETLDASDGDAAEPAVA